MNAKSLELLALLFHDCFYLLSIPSLTDHKASVNIVLLLYEVTAQIQESSNATMKTNCSNTAQHTSTIPSHPIKTPIPLKTETKPKLTLYTSECLNSRIPNLLGLVTHHSCYHYYHPMYSGRFSDSASVIMPSMIQPVLLAKSKSL